MFNVCMFVCMHASIVSLSVCYISVSVFMYVCMSVCLSACLPGGFFVEFRHKSYTEDPDIATIIENIPHVDDTDILHLFHGI